MGSYIAEIGQCDTETISDVQYQGQYTGGRKSVFADG